MGKLTWKTAEIQIKKIQVEIHEEGKFVMICFHFKIVELERNLKKISFYRNWIL